MNLQEIINKVDQDIEVTSFREHTKASEKYIDVTFKENGTTIWSGSIPYYYRRTGLFIESEHELIKYLNDLKEFFTKETINKFIIQETTRWNSEMKGKETTKEFFDKLLNMNWNSVKHDLPNNPNWARRIQDIKEFGYTLATNTNMIHSGSGEKATHIMLVPIPKGGTTGYEIMSPKFKKRALKALDYINAFESKKTMANSLIPDHKFPEIRWDENTKEENETLNDEEIIIKFQLLDNQRNLQKREVCRKCFQSNQRGDIYGIEYYYSGSKDWPNNVPKVGKEAEKGCVGCGWYDIQQWRNSLKKLLIESE